MAGRVWDLVTNNVSADEYRNEPEAGAIKMLLRQWRRNTVRFGVALALSVVSVVPFLYGHALHNHWNSIGKYLVMLSMVLLMVFLFCVKKAFWFWYELREIRKIGHS
jgi:hypothetical protein